MKLTESIQRSIRIIAIQEPGKPWRKCPRDTFYVWSEKRKPTASAVQSGPSTQS